MRNILDEICKENNFLLLKIFNINILLSAKGCLYDNIDVKAIYKIIKAVFAFNKKFESFEELEFELFDYVNCIIM